MKIVITCPQCDSQDIDETADASTPVKACICNNCGYADLRIEFMKYYKEE